MRDVVDWLEALELGQYAAAFSENDIDLGLLGDLTSDDLKELGVASLGHRKRLLAAALGLDRQPLAGVADLDATDATPSSYTPHHLADRIRESRSGIIGERKQVTVLFADVKDSFRLIAGTDPEQAQELLDGAVRVMMSAVHQFEGTVNKLLGDGIMALFGAPLAHEDHAVRACYAALGIRQGMADYAPTALDTFGVNIHTRIGIHSGEVVVRSIDNDLSIEYDAIGPTVHLASRLEAIARPDGILVSAATKYLVESYIETGAIGPKPIKGMAEPVEVFDVVGIGAARTRLEAATERGLTQFVGGDAHLETLESTASRVADGRGEVVAVVGDAGVGKSRLLHEFATSPALEHWRLISVSAASHARSGRWRAVIDLLRLYLGIDEGDGRDRVIGIVEENLGDAGDESIVPALLSLLNIRVANQEWAAMSAPQQRRLTLNALKSLLGRESAAHPLALVVEDLHRADPDTVDFLDSVIAALPATRIMLMLNYRPEFRHSWAGRTYYTQIRVDPLDSDSAARFASSLIGTDESTVGIRELLVERTEGNPLYLEESVRSLTEAGILVGAPGAYRSSGTAESVRVPPNVQTIIAARIDRLPPASKDLLQSAAVIGKTVPLEVLQRVSAVDEDDALHRSLADLRNAEFLVEAQLYPSIEYVFRHALTHDVAYDSVLASRRMELHRAAGEALESLYPNRLREMTDSLADHYERSETWGKAAHWLLESAVKAKLQFAYAAATDACERALRAAGREPGLDRDIVRAHVLAGDLASLRGDLTAANAAYDDAIELEPDDRRRHSIRNKRHRACETSRAGRRLVYYEHGDGDETLLFINPIVYGLATFQPVLEQLCQKYRIITMDPLGTGDSDPLTRPYPLDEHVDDVLAVLAASETDEVIGVGISRGGNLLVKLSVANPGLIKKLVLVSTAADDMGPGGLTPPVGDYVKPFVDAYKAKDTDLALRIFADSVVSGPGADDIAAQFADACSRLPLDTIRSFFDADPTANIFPLLSELRIPVLQMYGTGDLRVSEEAFGTIAGQIPDVRRKAFNGHGHLLLFTAADEFCTRVDEFVRTNALEAPPH